MIYLAIYLGILALLPVLVWRRPVVGITAYICVQVLDFWGQMASATIANNGKITNIYMVALLGLAVLRARIVNRSVPLVVSRAACFAALLWGYALLSVFWTPMPEAALEQWGHYWPYMVLVLFFVPSLIGEYEDGTTLLKNLIVLGGVLSLLVAVFVKWDGRYVLAFWDSNTKFWNALAFAQMAGYVAIAAALTNVQGRSLWIFLRIAVICVAMVVAVKSGSRGQFALMVAIPVLLLPIGREMRDLRAYLSIVLLVLVVGSASYFAFDYFSGDEQRWTREGLNSDLEGRMSMAQRVLGVWWQASSADFFSAIFGLGNSASFAPSVVGYYPHMVPIEVIAEEGLFGAAIFFGINIMFVRVAYRAVRASANNSEMRGVISALTGMYMFAFLLSFKQGSLLNTSPEMFMFLIALERIVVFEKRRVRAGVGDTSAPERLPVQRRYANICT